MGDHNNRSSDILEIPAHPYSGRTLWDRLRRALAEERGFRMTLQRMARIFGRRTSTAEHWLSLSDQPPKGLRPVRAPASPNDPPFMKEPSVTKGRPVRPVFCQRSGPFEFIWFSHGQPVPAVLWDNSVAVLKGLRFTWHKGHRAIHVRRKDEVIGFIWPCWISAPEVVASAKAQLRRMRAVHKTKA